MKEIGQSDGHGSECIVSAVVVTFNSEIDVDRLVGAVDGLVFVVDNSTDQAVRERLAESSHRAGAQYLAQPGNSGIGAAQNRGFRAAVADGAEYVLILDDDSTLSDVNALAGALRAQRHLDPTVVAAGPRVIDERTGEALVYAWQGPRLTQVTEFPTGADVVEAAFLVASGSLLHRTALSLVGEFRTDYFIDGVDVEWGLRASARGYRMIVIASVTMTHSLGDAANAALRYSHDSPIRDYYLTRNTMFLVRDIDISAARRLALLVHFGWIAVIKYFRSSPVRRRAIARGFTDSLKQRRGKAGADVEEYLR